MPRSRSSFRPRSSKVDTTETASDDSKMSFCTELPMVISQVFPQETTSTHFVSLIDSRHFEWFGELGVQVKAK